MSEGFDQLGFSGLNLGKSGRLEQYTKRTAFTIFKGIFTDLQCPHRSLKANVTIVLI